MRIIDVRRSCSRLVLVIRFSGSFEWFIFSGFVFVFVFQSFLNFCSVFHALNMIHFSGLLECFISGFIFRVLIVCFLFSAGFQDSFSCSVSKLHFKWFG